MKADRGYGTGKGDLRIRGGFDLVNHFVVAVWSAKRQNPLSWNPRETTIAILAALSVSLALADDFETINGKEYKNVEVGRQGRAQRRGLHRALLLAPARIARR